MLFVGCIICVASSTSMIIWCDHYQLFGFGFVFILNLRNVCYLVSGLPIWVRRVSDTAPLRMRRESSGAPHASLIYNFVVCWVVWNNFCFHVWHFAMTVMSSFWRYLFVDIALMTWPKTWPVGIDHCCAGYCLHGNLAKYAADLYHYLDTNLRAEKCVPEINIGLKTSRILYTTQWTELI